MSEDGIVFGLALLGYTLLSTDLALRAGRRPIALLSVVSALVATTHVGLVWTWRFDGSLTAALEGRAAGFQVARVVIRHPHPPGFVSALVLLVVVVSRSAAAVLRLGPAR